MEQRTSHAQAFRKPSRVFCTAEALQLLFLSTSLSSQSPLRPDASWILQSPSLCRTFRSLAPKSWKAIVVLYLGLTTFLYSSFHTLDFLFVSSLQIPGPATLKETLPAPQVIVPPAALRLLASAVPPPLPRDLRVSSTKGSSFHSSLPGDSRGKKSTENIRPEAAPRPIATAAANWWPQRWFLSLRLGRRHDIVYPDPFDAPDTNLVSSSTCLAPPFSYPTLLSD